MIFVLFNLTVWQNIYVFNQRTRGTNVLLLNNDTIIVSGGYGNGFPNTIVVKLDQFGNYIDARKTLNSRGGLIPGGYVINPANEVVITGEGIVDNSLNNYDAYRSPTSIVAVGESDYSSPISIYAIRIEGNAFLSFSEKPLSFTLNNIMFSNSNFTPNFSNINDKGNASFDFTNSFPTLINKSVICTPLMNNENKNCFKFEIVKNGIRIYGEGNLEIYSLNGELIFKGVVYDRDFIMLNKGFYIINRRKVFIY